MAHNVQEKITKNNLDVCKMEDQLKENVYKMEKSKADLILLGNAIRSIGSIMQTPEGKHWQEVNLDKGKGFYRTLDKNEYCHLIDAFYHPGSEFPPHTHKGFESIVVYYGLCVLKIIDTGEEVSVGDGHRRSYYWDARKPHSGYFPVATGCYGLTMPPGYND